MAEEKKLSTAQAATILHVQQMRVLQMLYQGKFGECEKFGNAYMIPASKVEEVRQQMLQDSRTNLAQGLEAAPAKPR
jgi:predicted XRE-type DNA-binding protein